MNPILRSLVAVVAAIVVAMILLIAVEGFSAVVHPFPADFDNTPAAMTAHVARYPQWVLAVVVPMWGFIGFLTTWIAGRLGARASALVIGVLLMAAVMCNLSMLPYPLWFKVVMPVVLAAAIVVGYGLSSVRRPVAGGASGTA